jgi:hypothetical protein
MINYFKYLLANPNKLAYCIIVLLFCTTVFMIILPQLTDNIERLFISFLMLLIFTVAQLQPIMEYLDKRK